MTNWGVRSLLAVLLLILTIVACSDDGEDPMGNGNGCDDFPCAEDLYFDLDYMTSPDWAEVIACRASSPHGPRMRIHIFPASAAAFYLDMDGRDVGFDEGTILVKTEYSSADCELANPVQVSVMRKGPAGTAAATGDWEWQQVNYINETIRDGQLPDCLTAACHTSPGCGPGLDYTCTDPDG